MYTVDGNNIIIPRGDSAELAIQLTDNSGEVYMLTGSQELRFDMYSLRSTSPVATATGGTGSQTAEGIVTVVIPSSSTAQLEGSYKYFLRLVDEANSISDTLIGFETAASVTIL